MEPYYESDNGVLYHGDCLDVMSAMPDDHIDLTVTSPPYDNLRKYKGFVFDFEATAKELFRITKKGGVVVWVVGDETLKGSETGTSFKQALFFKDCGFNLYDTMIYSSNKPPLTHRRYEQAFEYMFILSKGKPKTFNPIMRKNVWHGQKRYVMGSTSASSKENCAVRRRNVDIATKKFSIKNNIWHYKTGGSNSTKDKIAFKHPAIFPEQLANDHIISWSNEDDLIFDPLAGSGTTLKMAGINNRKWIGAETSEEYCEIAAKRIDNENRQLRLFA